ncbi:MAG: DUF1178 family protein [Rhodobacteraceae bacterium]|nr:DUF1178 family protein [Paracoccaceae bacterium]
MIRYALKCSAGHSFESWFQSADAYDTLRARKLVACPDCAGTDVDKAIMAPRIRPSRSAAAVPSEPSADPAPDLSTPRDNRAAAIAKLRKEVEKNSDYVGMNFAKEARAIHDGEAPDRAIYGEAKPEEAVKLLEDGVPVMPLPFVPKARAN